MRIFYCGDVVARAGREAVLDNIKNIRDEYKVDVMLVNVENAAHGFGVTPAICRDFLAKGADVLVLGNHFLNRREIVPFLNEYKRKMPPRQRVQILQNRKSYSFTAGPVYWSMTNAR